MPELKNLTAAQSKSAAPVDGAALKASYPQSAGQKPGCGFALMRVVGLLSLASGALLDYATRGRHVHESILCGRLMDGLDKGDIVPADRGFCSFLG